MPQACPVDRYVPRYSAETPRPGNATGLPVDRAFTRHSATPRSGNAAGLPRGSLRSSLQRSNAALRNATGLPRGSLRSSLPEKRRAWKCHGPAPWIVTFLATGQTPRSPEMPRAPPRGPLRSLATAKRRVPGNATEACPGGSLRSSLQRKRRASGNATGCPWIVTFLATAQTPREMPRPRPWIVTFTRYRANAAHSGNATGLPWTITFLATAQRRVPGNATGPCPWIDPFSLPLRFAAPSGNATGLPRGSLRSSLQRRNAALREMRARPRRIVPRASGKRRAPGNATGPPRGSFRSSLQRKRRASGNATGPPRGSLRSRCPAQKRRAQEMPQARPVDRYVPRYGAKRRTQEMPRACVDRYVHSLLREIAGKEREPPQTGRGIMGFSAASFGVRDLSPLSFCPFIFVQPIPTLVSYSCGHFSHTLLQTAPLPPRNTRRRSAPKGQDSAARPRSPRSPGDNIAGNRHPKAHRAATR